MLIDGLSMVDGSEIVNSHVESGIAFPPSPTEGRMFYMNAAITGYDKGLYVHNGTTWVTGDVTKITAGTGIVGGGNSGNISIGVDTAVIATKEYVNQTADDISTVAIDGGSF